MWKDYVYGKNYSTYLEAFFNSMSEGFAFHEMIYDETGKPVDYRFLETNDAFTEITGLIRKDILGKKISEFLPSPGQYWLDTYGRVAMTGEPVSFENYSAQLDKYFKVSAFSHVKGKFATFFTDITELKKASEIMKKHQILFENAQDIIFYTEDDGSIIDSNMNAALKYGYSLNELKKLNIQDLRHHSTFDSFPEQMKEADNNGITFECLHIKNDGTTFPAEVSVKSVEMDEIRLRIHIIRDITERKIAEDKIIYLANNDSLTGIPNRSFLMNHLNITMENAKRSNFKFALMLFDIDKFKEINDGYGHKCGDIVLMETTKKIQNLIREVDFIARLGGDEFVIIQPYINDKEDSSALAKRIIDELNVPLEIDAIKLNINLSIGISIFPDDSTNIDSLMSFSDQAMYLAKRKSGGSFHFY